MSSELFSVIVLAAGKGTRMRSSRPKVLHPLAGRPLLSHVLDAALALNPAAIYVVYGHGGDAVASAHAGYPVQWVEQPQQLGTGHAVRCAVDGIPDDHRVLVLYGDVPLIQADTLTPLLSAPGVALLSAELADPAGYGRVVRAGQEVRGIVEEKDATPEQQAIREINTGLLSAPARHLKRWLADLQADNAQGEYYLTDVVAMAVAEAVPVTGMPVGDPAEVQGVNDLVQLAGVERLWQRRAAERLMRAGLHLVNPDRFELRGELAHGEDCRIDAGVVCEGRVELGHRVTLGPGVVLRDTRIADDAVVDAYSVVEGAEVGIEAVVGPFARLRPGTVLAKGAKVGNFVETKAVRLGPGSKANHLTYLGDAEVGAGVNIGAGTITCNYDGAGKHTTRIDDDAFIGSGTELVAPVTVGRGATIGAGTTLSQDAPPGALTLERTRQRTVENWQRPGKPPSDGSTGDERQ